MGISDTSAREDALDAVIRKRDNVEGAALFSILPKRRDRRLLRLLVAYQVMWDFLDSVSERGAYAGQANGLQLHRALTEALNPDAPISDYYRYHPSKNDDGFLLSLVDTCRRICIELPSYRQVSDLILDGVARCVIQSLNHEPDPQKRNTLLRRWAESNFPDASGLDWFELTAAASAFMPHALLALAADPDRDRCELIAVDAAYFPWISLAVSMLDSYVDQAKDTANNEHSYISHYASKTLALARMTMIIRKAILQTQRLPNGRRHVVLAASMVGMYLSKKSANTPGLRAQTRVLVRAGGPLTILLLQAACLWRMTRVEAIAPQAIGVELPPSLGLSPAIQTFAFWRSPRAYCEYCRRCYGNRFVLRVMSRPPMVVLSDPRDIRATMTAPPDVLHPGEGGAMISPLVGECSFMLADEDEHLSGRKAVLFALQKRTVDCDAERLIDEVRCAVASWPQGVPLSLYPCLRRLSLEVILRTVFAPTGHGFDDKLAELRERTLAMLAVAGSVLLPLPNLRLGPGRTVWNRFLRNRQEVDALIQRIVRRRHTGSAGSDKDVLAVLLGASNQDGSPLSQCQLRDNVVTVLVSGHETTAAQLAWAFQLIAHNQRVQKRLIEEIDEGDGDAYLTATIQEVMRHRSVFLLTIPRAVVRPIEIGGWTYHPPVHLLGCIYLLHHDPDVYPEPDEFRPERFLEGQPSPHSYLPWGGGRRRCPGSHLAMLEMKTVLRAVLETMTVDPAGKRMERPKWRSVIVTPHAGSRVILRSRERRRDTQRRIRQTSAGPDPHG